MNQLTGTLLVALLGSGATAAIVSGLFTRRKISAEATEIVTRAAGAQVERLTLELQDVRSELTKERDARAELEKKIERIERRELSQRDLAQVHAAWDYRILEILRRHLTPAQIEAEQLHPAPPLYPPTVG